MISATGTEQLLEDTMLYPHHSCFWQRPTFLPGRLHPRPQVTLSEKLLHQRYWWSFEWGNVRVSKAPGNSSSLRHSSVCFKIKTKGLSENGIPLKLGDSAPFSTLRLPQPSPKKPWEQGAFTTCHATEDFESRASVTLQLKILGK